MYDYFEVGTVADIAKGIVNFDPFYLFEQKAEFFESTALVVIEVFVFIKEFTSKKKVLIEIGI